MWIMSVMVSLVAVSLVPDWYRQRLSVRFFESVRISVLLCIVLNSKTKPEPYPLDEASWSSTRWAVCRWLSHSGGRRISHSQIDWRAIQTTCYLPRYREIVFLIFLPVPSSIPTNAAPDSAPTCSARWWAKTGPIGFELRGFGVFP